MSTKTSLPKIYQWDENRYEEIAAKLSPSTTGDWSETSTSSEITYKTNNQGETGLMNSLWVTIGQYHISADDWNSKVNSSDLLYQTAGGTGTAITLTLPSTLQNGYSMTFVANANNNSANTTVNGINLYKPNTTTTPTLISGKAYTVWYNSANNCFFIKASAEGTTVASHVLAGDTFSNDSDTGLVGTMVENGTLNYTPSGSTQSIPAGYTSGGSVAAVSVPVAKVLNDTTIAGQTGTMPTVTQATPSISVNSSGLITTSATQSTAGYVVAGSKSATQQMTVQGTQTITPSTTDQTIAANQYLTGVQIIKGAANLVASNILNGISIFGIVGNAVNGAGMKHYTEGSGTSSASSVFAVIGLTFNPRIFEVVRSGSSWMYFYGYDVDSTYVHGLNGASNATLTSRAGGFQFTATNDANTAFSWYAWE